MAVDRVGAWDSYLVEFSMLQEISEQHKSAWAQAYSVVLGKWKEATTPEETNRALMWLGFLPQLLQRKPSRGGRKGRSEVAYRYDYLIKRDWGELVTIWERDRKKIQQWRLEQSGRRRKEQDEEDLQRMEQSKLRQHVMGLICSGDMFVQGYVQGDISWVRELGRSSSPGTAETKVST